MGKSGLHLEDPLNEGKWIPVTGEPNGSLPVTVQDQVVPFYYIKALIEVGTFVIDANTVANSYEVVITSESARAIVAGDTLEFANGNILFQSTVISRSVNTLTLDRFWTEAYDKTLFTCFYGTTNLKGNGSVTPYMARFYNSMTTASLDITQIDMLMTHATEFSFDGFAGIATPLPRGVQFITDIANGTVRRSGFNFESNGQIQGVLDTHALLTKVGGSLYGLSGKKYLGLSPHLGSVIRLIKDRGDSLEIWIQDDLTTLGVLEIYIEGSAVVD